jgi:RNA polymerase subunit RPABC4/transcription elongation factor Spt4
MPVCLHCGELQPEGALFCTKCGFTLPQVGAAPPPPPAAASGGTSSAGPGVPPPPVVAWTPGQAPGSPVAYPLPPGATAPMPTPPSGKYCIRCRTIISQAAVFCPVCQQPQVP